ncbi:MAG: VOC family protein [Rhodospirillaceae bacterium]|nr:VOC family protein [Rhodospirillaceae bacterium]
MNAIDGIDHTLVGVRDLEAARDQWARMGFTVTPRGRHIGWGTGNYCIMLDRGYIELLGIVNAAGFTNNLDRFLETREGLMGLAFASDDAVGCAGALRDAGIAADGPKELKRLLELPAGTVTPAFSLVYLPGDAVPALSAFVCQHLTPDLVRRPEWLAHANGAKKLLGMTVASNDPASLGPAYRRLLGDRAVRPGDGWLRVETGAGWLDFATPDVLARRYARVAPWPDHARPWAVAMTVGVADITRCRAALVAGDFAPRASGFGRNAGIVLGPDDAGGLYLEFVGV